MSEVLGDSGEQVILLASLVEAEDLSLQRLILNYLSGAKSLVLPLGRCQVSFVFVTQGLTRVVTGFWLPLPFGRWLLGFEISGARMFPTHFFL